MRLMSMVALFVAAALALTEAMGKGTGKTEIILYFLLAAFAPKALQRFGE